jgi:hypothetical protein
MGKQSPLSVSAMSALTKHRSLGIFALTGFGLSVVTALLAAAAPGASSPSRLAAEPFTPDDVALFMDQYCATCHNDVDTEGDLDITALKFTPSDPDNLEMWRKVYDQTKSGEMPPKEKRRPREPALKEFLEKVGAAIEAAESAAKR